ncbi:MAG: DUF3943 domain-containing protein [Endomicrobia bacterium]|nr:DUF3943 domain-containing protein [Endomicrobiia bacterium]
MRAILCKKIIILILFSCFTNAFAQNSDAIWSGYAEPCASKSVSKYAPLIALSEGAAINAVVHLFDRYILKESWAQVSFSDIGDNFKKGFVWDNDIFSTNAFFHPYHGSLYFNSARANGLSFWQSVPYPFIGSLIWEFACENNYPSINDLVATSLGGIALGEITHRISFLILDDSKRGLERAGREILAGIISPMDLFNRILTGKAWRHCLDEKEESEREYFKEKFHINISVFSRFMADLNRNRDSSNVALGFAAIYGDPFADKERLPYDFFVADINFNIIGNQPIVTEASVVGPLWGKQWEKQPRTFFAGIFQHFDYYDSNSFVKNGPIPYKFAAPSAFGGGIYVKKQKNENELPVFYGSFHANFVLLGASESDYYFVYERDYNYGTGYNFELSALVNFTKSSSAFIKLKTYKLFTFNEEEDGPYDSIYDEYSVQGNHSNTRFHIFNAGCAYRLTDDWSIGIEQRFYLRKSRYKSFKTVSSNSTETRLRLTYSIFN